MKKETVICLLLVIITLFGFVGCNKKPEKNIEYIEVEVEVEKPVEIIIEKEVIKEVVIEKEVEVIVTKEILKEIEIEIIKEVPVIVTSFWESDIIAYNWLSSLSVGDRLPKNLALDGFGGLISTNGDFIHPGQYRFIKEGTPITQEGTGYFSHGIINGIIIDIQKTNNRTYYVLEAESCTYIPISSWSEYFTEIKKGEI